MYLALFLLEYQGSNFSLMPEFGFKYEKMVINILKFKDKNTH